VTADSLAASGSPDAGCTDASGGSEAAGTSLRRCAAGEGIEVLQEKWVLHIVHALLDGPKGFNELGREVGGCNPTTLTQRLARLEALGVIHKDVSPHANPRCSYTLTEAGLGLERVIAAIRSWAASHLRTS
jgi:DNA-binding HxlR family transcriptional regulator